jgi:hypothetical protein
MGTIFKTKNYFFGISFFCLACSSSLFLAQLSTNSSLLAAAPAARLDDWRFTPEKLQLEFILSGETRPRHFSLNQPDRIVIDLPNTKLGYVTQKQEFSGAIKSIRISQLKTDVTRIVLDVAPGTTLDANQVQLQPFTWQNQNIWVLSPVRNVAYNNSPPQNNNSGSFEQTQQAPLFPQLPGNNNFPDLDDQETPLFPQLPGNNNFPGYPDNQTQTNYNYSNNSNFPVPSNSQFPPQVVVPSLNSNNNPQPLLNPILPPAIFNNQPGWMNNIPTVNQPDLPNFPTPNLPQYQQNIPGFQVLPYGQPLPQPGQ